MPTTLMRNPLSVAGTPASPTSTAGAQPTDSLNVQGTTGQETTGTGQVAGKGANVTLKAGNGGRAPSGSTNGAGGSIVINPGSPGNGGGSGGDWGSVLMCTVGNGNVGIGTATPGGRLHITGPTSSESIFFGTQITSGTREVSLVMDANDGDFVGGNYWSLRQRNANGVETFDIVRAGSAKLTFLSNGFLGINNTTPGSMLHVEGGMQVGSPSGGDKGNGSINVSGDFYRNGVAIAARLEKAYSQITALMKRIDKLETALKRTSGKPAAKRSSVKKAPKSGARRGKR